MADRSLRCTVQFRALGPSPAGSASAAPTFVLVETPLPWPHDVGDHPLLAPLAPVLKPHRARLQALAATAGEDEPLASEPGRVRVVVYRQAGVGGAVGRYVRSERVTDPERLVATVVELLDPGGDIVPADGGGSGDSPVRDVLVCTHGSRDVCCGRDGMALYQAMKALDLPGVRVWRTSHTGGHRFAPTGVTFPDGRAWAWADADLLAGILTRSLDPAVAAQHDRGSTVLKDPFAQAADAAVLAEEGWAWLDRPRTVEVTAPNGDDHRMVTLTSDPPAVSYRAEVVVKRIVPVPDCGRPLDEARKSSPEVEVVHLERL